MAAAPDQRMSRTGFWQRIQGKLVLLLLVLLIPLLLVQAYALYDRFRISRAAELHANLELARAVGKSFETFVRDVLHQELSIGLALSSSQPPTGQDIKRILVESLSGHSAVAAFAWVDPNGTLIAASDPRFVGISISGRKRFRDIVAGRDWTVSDLVISRASGAPRFAIIRAIRNDRGKLLGMVLASIAPDRLDGVLGIERSRGGGIALVDRNGRLVYRYPHVNMTWEERDWIKRYPIFAEPLRGKEIATSVYADFEGRDRLVGFTPVKSIGWVATAGITEDIAMAPITSQLIPEAIIFLLITLGALCAASVLSRFISVPVKQLRDHARALGREETPGSAVVSGPAEIRELASSLNEMAERLRSRGMGLRQQREWLQVTLTSIGDGVLTTDTEGRVTFLNPVAAHLTGWKPEEAVGRPVQGIFRIINEKTRDSADDIVGRVLREECTVALANQTALVSSDGKEIPIEDSAAPIRDAEGNISGVVLVFHDVTERRRAREALRESEERLRLFIEHAPASLAMFDRDMRYLSFSRRWLSDYGLGGRDLKGLSHYDIFPEITEEWREIHRRALAGEVLKADEDRFERTDGTVQWLRWEIRPWHDAVGNVGGVVVFTEDITERRKMIEKIESLARFPSENPNPVLRISPDGELLYANKASAGLLDSCGLDQDGKLSEQWRQMAQETLEKNSIREIEAAGADAVYSLLFVPVRRFGYSNVYGKDITRRKQMEEALRESEERFRVIANSIPQLAWIAGADGYIRWYNQRWYEYTGTTPEQMERWGWQSVHDPDVLPGVLERWKESISTGKPIDMVFPLRGADGHFRQFLTRVQPVKNLDGDVIQWCGTNTDITDRKQMEDELHRSESQFKLLAEIAGNLLASDNPQGIVNEICRNVMAHLDCDAFFNFLVDESTGKLHLNAYAGISEEEAGKMEWLDFGVAVCGCAARDGVRIVAEDIFNTPDARADLVRSYGIQAYACHPLKIGGRVIGTLSFGTKTRPGFSSLELAVMNTVADQVAVAMERIRLIERLGQSRDELELRVQERTAELKTYMAKLEQSNRALNDFASIASHDLQEPLRKISSFGNMLKTKCGPALGEQGQDYLERVLNAAGRMHSLLQALLQYSRITTKAEPVREVNLTEIVREVLADLEVRISQTKADVHLEELPAILADPMQMRQLFQNLIGNALKFHKDGERPVVKVQPIFSDDAGCRIMVEDNGIGFDEQYLERIFAPFQRLHGRSSQYEGTGMGLAICKKIVERHGGSIKARSAPGMGARFIVELPAGRPVKD